MFRSLYRSLTASRSRTRAPRAEGFRPQLEDLEGRLAPSGMGPPVTSQGYDNVAFQFAVRNNNHISIDGSHNLAAQVFVGSGNTITIK